ncbi:MAG: AAA family ATPase [Actinomycetota bacterium]
MSVVDEMTGRDDMGGGDDDATGIPTVDGVHPALQVGYDMADRVERVVLGQQRAVRLAVAGLLAGEHLLLHDEPGVGKTTLARALARVLGGTFGRIQGTVDLLPGDLTGVTLVDPRSGNWTFRPGPLLSNVVLVDELNRLSPRTQSALLEAMAEGQVTVDGESHAVPTPFVVIATMNPHGSAGTFPFAAGQLDRFGVSLSLGASPREIERRLLGGEGGMAHVDELAPVAGPQRVAAFVEHANAIEVAPEIIEYVLDLCEAVRRSQHLSTRAPLAVLGVARAWAALHRSSYVGPDDVKAVVPSVLGHRAATDSGELDQGVSIVRRAVDAVAAPRP